MASLITTLNGYSSSVTQDKCHYEKCVEINSKVQRCSKCCFVWYCSPTCQRADWQDHKAICQMKYKESLAMMNPANEILAERPMPISGLRLIENFVPKEIEAFLCQLMIQEGIPEQNIGHYDGYKFKDENKFNLFLSQFATMVFDKLRELTILRKSFDFSISIVGYEKDGFIPRHVDSSELGGEVVLVFSFNSPIVLNFYSEKIKGLQHKIFIPPRSFYIMEGEVRYDWSHAVLKNESEFRNIKFQRGRRFALLLTPPGPKYKGGYLLHYRNDQSIAISGTTSNK